MQYFLGIDLGTSSVKSLLMDENGSVTGVAQRAYDMQKPKQSWAEQDMAFLWNATSETLQELMGRYPSLRTKIAGVGYSGQMHGLVMLDQDGELVRDAIIWADQRSQDAIIQISQIVPDYRDTTLNTLSTGFFISSLMWVKTHEPEIFEKIHTIMLPKDYIRYRMCGEIGTDWSDASGTDIFDTAKRQWAWEMIRQLDLEKSFFVPCHGSWETAGQVTRHCAEETGLPEGISIVYGGGDTLVQTVGNGVTDSRTLISNIGTASQLLCLSNRPLHDPAFRTNTFCHVNPKEWLLMGANLNGGIVLKWLKNILEMESYAQMTDLALQAEPGSGGLICLPYLNGERTPWNDPQARGIFFGLNLNHGRKEWIRAVMEGIIFAQRESFEIFRQMGLQFNRIVASGGGARGIAFRTILASTLNCEVMVNQMQEQGCVGAAILAAVGTGAFSNLEQACSHIVHFDEAVTQPDPMSGKRYDELFMKFHELYPANKKLFQSCGFI